MEGVSQEQTTFWTAKKWSDKCACLDQWSSQIEEVYPDPYFGNIVINKAVQMLSPIFSDAQFVPFTGVPIDELTVEQRATIAKIIEKCITHKKYKANFKWHKILRFIFEEDGSETGQLRILLEKYNKEKSRDKAFNDKMDWYRKLDINADTYTMLKVNPPTSRLPKLVEQQRSEITLLYEQKLEEANLVFLEAEWQELVNREENILKLEMAKRYIRIHDLAKMKYPHQGQYFEKATNYVEEISNSLVRMELNKFPAVSYSQGYLIESNAWFQAIKNSYRSHLSSERYEVLKRKFIDERKVFIKAVQKEPSLIIGEPMSRNELRDLLILIYPRTIEEDSFKSALTTRFQEFNMQLKGDGQADGMATFFANLGEAPYLKPLELEESIKTISIRLFDFSKKYKERDSMKIVAYLNQRGITVSDDVPLKLEVQEKFNIVTTMSKETTSRNGSVIKVDESENRVFIETLFLQLKSPAIVYRNGLFVKSEVILGSNIEADFSNITLGKFSSLTFGKAFEELLRNVVQIPIAPFPQRQLNHILDNENLLKKVTEFYQDKQSPEIGFCQCLKGLSNTFSNTRLLRRSNAGNMVPASKIGQNKLLKRIRNKNIRVLNSKYFEDKLPYFQQELYDFMTFDVNTTALFKVVSKMSIVEPNCFIEINGQWRRTSAPIEEIFGTKNDVEDLLNHEKSLTESAAWYLSNKIKICNGVYQLDSPFEIEYAESEVYANYTNQIIINEVDFPNVSGFGIDQIIKAFDRQNQGLKSYEAELLYFYDKNNKMFVAGLDGLSNIFQVHPFPVDEIDTYIKDKGQQRIKSSYEYLKEQYPGFAFALENSGFSDWLNIHFRAKKAIYLSN